MCMSLAPINYFWTSEQNFFNIECQYPCNAGLLWRYMNIDTRIYEINYEVCLLHACMSEIETGEFMSGAVR